MKHRHPYNSYYDGLMCNRLGMVGGSIRYCYHHETHKAKHRRDLDMIRYRLSQYYTAAIDPTKAIIINAT
jgi:hypothetical protein